MKDNAKKQYKETDILKKINTTLTLDEIKQCNDNGWYYNELIRIGIQAKENKTSDNERLNKMEKRLKTLERIYLNK